MEPILGSSICLICFEKTEKHIFVPSDAPEKLFINCKKYLHSTLINGTLKDIKIHNEKQVPLCKKCFDSALELTQLSEQLTTIQKDISDLTVAFSMAVFHRRSQIHSIGQSCKTSSIIEFNEACLPPNLFSMKLGDQNIQSKKNNQEKDINDLHIQTDISNMKCEASDIQFDNLSRNPQQSVANDDIEIQFNKDNLSDKQCEQAIIVQNQNLACVSEMKIVNVTGRNDSKMCADPKNGVRLTMSDLLKSVKMPKIKLERIKMVGHKIDVSVDNSNRRKCEFRQNNLVVESLFKNDDFSLLSCATKSPENGKLLKCCYCDMTFTQERHRTLHHKTHTRGKLYKSPKEKFVYRSNQKICEVTHTRKKSIYKCSYCKKGFSNRYHFKVHERTHIGEKPLKCSFCNHRFNTLSNQKSHERIHTGEKPYKCSFCNTRFNQSSNLKTHERIHTGEKPFKCSFCNDRFTHSTSLKHHQRIHTGEKPFKCSLCNNRYSQRIQLKHHEKTHSGKKHFKKSQQKYHQEQVSTLISLNDNRKDGCPGHLQRQEPMHSTGPMEFKCSFCEMTFSDNEERANHEKIHETEDEIGNENFIVGI